ncbi:MAG TPA: SpoIIE family protein phosphatase [Pyrinomonadaceae bacterium]|nr:SpoIIE family protein phosphatase [Pyrinomonadaceae bacterium]
MDMSIANTASIPRTLIADDQPDVAIALRLLLKEAGYHTEAVNSPAAVLEAIKREKFDLVLMDLNYARDTTSGQEGLDLITSIRHFDSMLPVVVITGWATVELAVEAMHRGVRDFVQKPWDNSTLLHTLRTQIEWGRRRRQRSRLEKENRKVTKRLTRELGDAEEIQRALLPKQLPLVSGFELAVAWEPANAVSGDYFDVLTLDEHHTGICVADVAGKGMSAALLMSNLQAALKSLATPTIPTGDLMSRINSLICENIVAHRFISCFYGSLDTRTRKFTYCNAGHYAPMLVRDGRCIRLRERGPVFGVFANEIYEQSEIQLQSGDVFALFTDGVTEVRNTADEEFGEDRLEELLLDQTLTAAELRNKVMSAVKEFGSGTFDDDVTLLVLKANSQFEV